MANDLYLIKKSFLITQQVKRTRERLSHSNWPWCILPFATYFYGQARSIQYCHFQSTGIWENVITTRVWSTRQGTVFTLFICPPGGSTPVSGSRSLSSLWSHVLSGGVTPVLLRGTLVSGSRSIPSLWSHDLSGGTPVLTRGDTPILGWG